MKLNIHHQKNDIYVVKLADGKIRRKIITIPFGYVLDTEDEKNLVLLNGNIQKLESDGSVDIIKFEKSSINLAKSKLFPERIYNQTYNNNHMMLDRGPQTVFFF